MKTKDVQVGARLYANIGARLCAVIVVEKVDCCSWKGKRSTKFRVKRPGERLCLPKLRTAAALREKPVKYF